MNDTRKHVSSEVIRSENITFKTATFNYFRVFGKVSLSRSRKYIVGRFAFEFGLIVEIIAPRIRFTFFGQRDEVFSTGNDFNVLIVFCDFRYLIFIFFEGAVDQKFAVFEQNRKTVVRSGNVDNLFILYIRREMLNSLTRNRRISRLTIERIICGGYSSVVKKYNYFGVGNRDFFYVGIVLTTYFYQVRDRVRITPDV